MMTDGTTSTPQKPLTFSGRAKMTWHLLSLHWALLGDCLLIVWSSGATVSSSLTGRQSGKLDIESARGRVALEADRKVRRAIVTITWK
jgi:hypothetical protein